MCLSCFPCLNIDHRSNMEDEEKKVTPIKRSPKAKPRTLDIEPTGFDSPLSKRPLILSRTCKKVQSSTTNSTEMIFEPPLVSLDTGVTCHSDLLEVRTAACELPGDSGTPTVSCLVLSPRDELHPEEQADSVKDEACFSEERGPCEGEHICFYEHSYCRPDTDNDQLWRKILSLHSKILELDRREESTVAKIHALETEVARLKRDGAVFKEKHNILEDYISSMLL